MIGKCFRTKSYPSVFILGSLKALREELIKLRACALSGRVREEEIIRMESICQELSEWFPTMPKKRETFLGNLFRQLDRFLLVKEKVPRTDLVWLNKNWEGGITGWVWCGKNWEGRSHVFSQSSHLHLSHASFHVAARPASLAHLHRVGGDAPEMQVGRLHGGTDLYLLMRISYCVSP